MRCTKDKPTPGKKCRVDLPAIFNSSDDCRRTYIRQWCLRLKRSNGTEHPGQEHTDAEQSNAQCIFESPLSFVPVSLLLLLDELRASARTLSNSRLSLYKENRTARVRLGCCTDRETEQAFSAQTFVLRLYRAKGLCWDCVCSLRSSISPAESSSPVFCLLNNSTHRCSVPASCRLRVETLPARVCVHEVDVSTVLQRAAHV
jgi:hypothetical protein